MTDQIAKKAIGDYASADISSGDQFLSYSTTAAVGQKVRRVNIFPGGTTANRPTSPLNYSQYFDTDLGKPIWYDGSGWVDATGASA